MSREVADAIERKNWGLLGMLLISGRGKFTPDGEMLASVFLKGAPSDDLKIIMDAMDSDEIASLAKVIERKDWERDKNLILSGVHPGEDPEIIARRLEATFFCLSNNKERAALKGAIVRKGLGDNSVDQKPHGLKRLEKNIRRERVSRSSKAQKRRQRRDSGVELQSSETVKS